MNIVAHRGYPAKYPDNTLPGFAAVLKHPECGRKITGIEIDIQLSADNRIVVFHDSEIEVAGQKKPVSSFTYAEFVEICRPRLKGENVCLFEEVLRLVDHRLELLVEIKAGNYRHSILLDSVAALLKCYRPVGSEIIIHSFSAQIMRSAVRRLAGENPKYGILCCHYKDLEEFKDILDKVDYIHPHWAAVIAEPGEFMGLRHPLHIWTVNSKEDYAKLMRLPDKDQIRAIMTDDIDLICGIPD